STYGVGELLVNNNVYSKNKKTIPVEIVVEILKNERADQYEIYPNTMLDVDLLSFKTELGEYYYNIPIPTNRTHYENLINYAKKIKDWATYYKLKQEFADLRPRDA